MPLTLRNLLIALGLLCSVMAAFAKPEPEDVSIVQLLANPKEYDGKFVRLIGYVALEFEGTAIFLHKEDCDHALMANGLWLDVDEAVLKKRKEYHHKYVLIEGTFNAKNKGHLGAWPAAVEKISRWYIWKQ